jgi:CheY-like chemotaxis protein
MAPSLHDSPLGVPLAGAIILYFSVLGFLGGYLLTRIYISQLISRADTLTRSGGQVQLESGKLVDVDELTRMQQPVIEDLQAQVASLVGASAGTGAAAAAAAPDGAMSAAAPPVPPLRVLWADDRPHSITLQVNMLENEGHHVDTAVDIDQALAALKSRRYDLLITDMHRVERGEDRPTAGLDLLRAAKQQAGDLPVMIFCGKKRAEQFAEEARSSGAALITSSSTALLAAVRDIAKARAGSS